MPAHAARLSPGRQCPHKAGAWPGHQTTAGIPHSSQEAPEEPFSSGSFVLEILLYLEFSSVPREPLLSTFRYESRPHLQKLKDLRSLLFWSAVKSNDTLCTTTSTVAGRCHRLGDSPVLAQLQKEPGSRQVRTTSLGELDGEVEWGLFRWTFRGV